MAKRGLKKRKEKTDLRQPDDSAPMPPPRDPIEPDPMNPAQIPSADTEPKSDRPDLDWAEHED